MKLDPKSARSLNFFTAQMVKVSKPGILGLVVLGLILAGGVYALLVHIIEGHIVTGMRDNVVWGILASEARRGLGDTDAPLWMVYTLIVLLSAVWFHYAYVLFLIIKIKLAKHHV